jgi:beta-glucosidase
MRRYVYFVIVLFAFVSACSVQPHADKIADANYLSNTPVKHDASWAVEWWLPRHKQKLQELKDRHYDIDLVFLGDSITHAWESKGKEYWEAYYGDRKAFNLGFGGDRTEHVLWRIQNGALDGISPKMLVLMIGTNNTGHRQDPANETAYGIQNIIAEIRTRVPTSQILLLAIFPRAELPSDPLRQLNNEVNTKIEQFADNKQVFFANINHLFLDDKGVLSTSIMNDLLHPESAQYEVWANAIEPQINKVFDAL